MARPCDILRSFVAAVRFIATVRSLLELYVLSPVCCPMQRGIGNKTAEELQEAAAALKAQTTAKRQEVVCEPQPAKAAGESDASSGRDHLSDGYSSDLYPPTPELVPASPSGLSTGASETDDKVPIYLEATCSQQDTLGDFDESFHAQPAQVKCLKPLPSYSAENSRLVSSCRRPRTPCISLVCAFFPGCKSEDFVRTQASTLLSDSSLLFVMQEALNLSDAAQEATTFITDCATVSTIDIAITATDVLSVEVPALRHNKYTWELSPEAQVRCYCLALPTPA